MAAVQRRPRLMQSLPAAQLSVAQNCQYPASLRPRGISELNDNLFQLSVIIINFFLGSVIIIVVTAAMVVSRQLEIREIPDPACLRVLAYFVASQFSSSEDEGVSKVDST